MSSFELVQIIIYFGLIVACTPLFGGYLQRVFEGRRTFLSPVLHPVEVLIGRLSGINSQSEQNWKDYTISLMVFNILGFLVLFCLQRFQENLPLNPEGLPAIEPLLALNTASSFMTNTNWQAYSGETTMSQLTQMLGLGVQNFLSAATGIAVAIALIRGLARKSTTTIGIGCSGTMPIRWSMVNVKTVPSRRSLWGAVFPGAWQPMQTVSCGYCTRPHAVQRLPQSRVSCCSSFHSM